MATGSQYISLNNKQSLGLVEIRDRLFGAMEQASADVVFAVWDADGWFGPGPVISSPGAGTITLGQAKGTDGLGKLVETAEAYSYDAAVPFENAAAVYYVGLMSVRIPDVIKNSRESGEPQYTGMLEIVGNQADPDSVADGGGTIDFVVDSVCEAGRSCAGRTVRVYLKTPLSADPAVAWEDLTVSWDGSNNVVSTTAALGQTTISTTASDYTATLLGPRIERDTDLSGESGVLFVGTVTGNGGTPTVFDTAGATDFLQWPDLANVTEYGTNNDLKLRVQTHASDGTGDRQISVLNTSSGYYVFEVDSYGVITTRSQGTGAVIFQVNTDGDIIEFNGQLRSTLNRITFDDANTTVDVGVTASTPVTKRIPSEYQEQSILGAMEGGLTNELFSGLIIEGGVPSDGGGLNFDYTEMEALYQGSKWVAPAGTLVVADVAETVYVKYSFATQLFSEVSAYGGDKQYEVYLAKVVKDGVGGITSVLDIRRPFARLDQKIELVAGDTGSTAYDRQIAHYPTIGEALAAIDVWANDDLSPALKAFSIRIAAECTETATLVVPVDGLEIHGTTGDGTGSDGTPVIKWGFAGELFDPNGKSGLWLHDFTMKFTGATVGGSGVPTVVGIKETGGSSIAGTRFDRLVQLSGDAFIYYNTTANIYGMTVEDCGATNLDTGGIFLDFDGATVVDGLRVRGNRVAVGTGTPWDAGYRYGIFARNGFGCWVDGNDVEGDWGSGAIYCEDFTEQLHISGNTQAASAGTPYGVRLIGCPGAYVGGNNFSQSDKGVDLNTSPRCRVVDNDFKQVGNSAGDACIDTGSASGGSIFKGNTFTAPYDIGIEVASPSCIVADNDIRSCGAANTATTYGIHIKSTAQYASVRGNTVEMQAGGSITTAIFVEADNCRVQGNGHDSEGEKLHVTGDDCSVQGNHTMGGGIDVDGARNTVQGNHLKGASGTGSIVTAAGASDYHVITGNSLNNGTGTVTAHANDTVANNL